jgi:hypothetical protein
VPTMLGVTNYTQRLPEFLGSAWAREQTVKSTTTMTELLFTAHIMILLTLLPNPRAPFYIVKKLTAPRR